MHDVVFMPFELKNLAQCVSKSPHCVCRIHQRFLLRVITICLIVRVRIFAGTKPNICQIFVQLRFCIIPIIQLVLTTLSQKCQSVLPALSSVFVVFLLLLASCFALISLSVYTINLDLSIFFFFLAGSIIANSIC